MVRRFFVLIFLFSFILGVVPLASAQTETRVFLDALTVAKGYTVVHANAAVRLGIPSDALREPATISLRTVPDALPDYPNGWKAISDPIALQVRNAQDAPISLTRNMTVTLRAKSNESYAERQLFLLDAGTETWKPFGAKPNASGTSVRASGNFSETTFVVLENAGIVHGVASWYGSRKPMAAAANAYPSGTKLFVTNKANNKSVTVTVVSTGPFARGRVVDLSKDAFQTIAPLGSGVAHVTVRAAQGRALPTANPVRQLPAPRVGAQAAFVMDAHTGQMLYEKNPDDVHPIASITKLMTGLMTLEAQTPFSNAVTIESSDAADGAQLRVQPGETLTVKQLFYSTLAASANNAANALARSTGMARPDFVAAMNTRAKKIGLTYTTFVEPSGLDPKNVSTAREVAMLSREAFRPLAMLQATTAKAYGFSTMNTHKPHQFKNTNTLLNSPLHITGSKTGYLDEAGYTLTIRARNKNNTKSVIAVVLGAATSKQRFDETNALAEWALAL